MTQLCSRREPVRTLVCLFASLCLGAVALSGCRGEPSPPQGPPPESPVDEKTLSVFSERIEEYVELHRRFEGALPNLPDSAEPAAVDGKQRELGRRIAAAREGAQQGDVLTATMQALIRRHMARVFGGPDGANVKASVMDENPVDLVLKVNQRYPDEVPMATMPPEVLQLLPKMPEELEYRFVGRHLAILDVHAHLIVDFVPNVIPA
jgi:hypothetical protein